jgi:hypothetical protein
LTFSALLIKLTVRDYTTLSRFHELTTEKPLAHCDNNHPGWTRSSGLLAFRSVALALLFFLSAVPARAEQCTFNDSALGTRPLPEQGPTDIRLRLYVNDLVSIHDVEQSFHADVLFRAEWQDPRLRHDGPTACRAAPHQIWTPVMQILNRRSVDRIREPELSVFPDGNVLFLVRSYGEFSFRADLSDFPFDQQELMFSVVSTFGPENVRLVSRPELFALGDQLSVANWSIETEGMRSATQYVAPVDRKLERMDFVLHAQRLTGYYTWQQLLPLVLVVMMTCVVFWVPYEFVPARVGLAATSMLTLIAYRFAMSSVLPPIAYLTRLDVFMIGASVLVFAGLVTTVAVSYFQDRQQGALADTVNNSARWLSPLLLALVAVGAFYS